MAFFFKDDNFDLNNPATWDFVDDYQQIGEFTFADLVASRDEAFINRFNQAVNNAIREYNAIN